MNPGRLTKPNTLEAISVDCIGRGQERIPALCQPVVTPVSVVTT
jgi:hypothetical protein